MRSPPKPNFVSNGPCNHLLVPQGVFVEPASSRLHHFRYSDIVFKLAGFPDRGVKISSILNPRPALLEGWDEPILKDVTERELKVQIMVSLSYTRLNLTAEMLLSLLVARLQTLREAREDPEGGFVSKRFD